MAINVISRELKRPSTVKFLTKANPNTDQFKLRLSNNLDVLPKRTNNRCLFIRLIK